MYTTRFCPYCMRARQLLDAKGVAYNDIAVDGDPARRAEMETASGRHTVPQIWVGDTHVGGFDDLRVRIQKRNIQPSRQSPAHRRLARAHHAHENNRLFQLQCHATRRKTHPNRPSLAQKSLSATE